MRLFHRQFYEWSECAGVDFDAWLVLMYTPAGPSAVTLITIVQFSDAGTEHDRKNVTILTISYAISLNLAVVMRSL